MMRKYLAHMGVMVFSLFFSLADLLAQSPTHIDTRTREPHAFTLDDILLYIVFPALLFIAAIWARRYQKKKQEEKETPEA